MTDPLVLPVLMRMATAALVVVCASLATDRAGPFWGAIIVSLPVSAGPAYVLLAQEHDAAFLAASALASLASFAATPIYLLAYSRLALRHATALTATAALAVWLACVMVVREVPWTLLSAVLVNLVVFAICFWLTRGMAAVGGGRIAISKKWFDLPLRAAATAVLVATVVTLSGYLGPVVTGIAAVAPIATMSLALAIQPRIGAAATAATMVGAIRAMPGIGFGFVVLYLTATRIGSGPALALALVVSALWPLGLIALRLRRNARATAAL